VLYPHGVFQSPTNRKENEKYVYLILSHDGKLHPSLADVKNIIQYQRGSIGRYKNK
jgi:hypothetical protein